MTVIIMLAVIVEALVEYGKSIAAAAKGGWKAAVLQLCAAAAGAVLCLAAGADLFAVLELGFAVPWMGRVLTGILISRGANYLSDFMGRLTRSGEVA